MRSATRARLRLLLFAIVVGLGAAVVVDVVTAGGLGSWFARQGVAGPYQALGRRIDIGARSLYLDCRGAGAPTIVLEAGMGSDSSTWSAVHDRLALTTRTCAYDRAGLGRSDPRGLHTLAESALDLRALLRAAQEPAPYLLVAHSLGGAYARVFAGSMREEIVGLVMVDTFDPDLQDAWIHPLLGPLRGEYEAELDGLRDLVARVDSLAWAASEAEMHSAVLAGLPIEFVTAARYEPRLDERTNGLIASAWTAARESLSPGRVRHTTVVGAGHYVHLERPEFVIDAVRRMLATWRPDAHPGATGPSPRDS